MERSVRSPRDPNDYESGLKREALLRQAFEQQKKKAMVMKEKAIQYNILKREADTNRPVQGAPPENEKQDIGWHHASNIQLLTRPIADQTLQAEQAPRILF
jgi:hypothetical protein